MTIYLERFRQDTDSTIGRLSIVDNNNKVLFSCYTLENKYEGALRNQDLRVPSGVYNLYWRNSPSKGMRVHLYNDIVPKDRYIMIHPGNYEKDTLGCILLGKSHSANAVNHSRAAVQEFENVIRKYASPDLKEVKMQIVNVFANR